MSMNEDNIKILNDVFGDVSLKEDEERSMKWFSGWEPSTAKNIIQAIKRAERISHLENGVRKAWLNPSI